jgi:hypothetical protein
LYRRVANNLMPPRNVKERPTGADRAILDQWIVAGAPAFPDEAISRKFIGIASVFTAALDHLRSLEPEDRKYVRFFTLHYQANNPDPSEPDLRMVRAALSKAINSLSKKPRIVVPTAVDSMSARWKS